MPGDAAPFRAPGRGRWTLDAGRFPRPVTRTLEHVLPDPVARGFRAATRPYGLLLDHVAWRFVDGWAYMSPRRTASLRGRAVPDRAAWEGLVHSSLPLQRRLATSAHVFERRTWRAELAAWQCRDKPAMTRANLRAARTVVVSLSDDALLAHLATCRANLARALYLHHRYDVTPAVAVGDLIAALAEWTGAPAVTHLRLLGTGPRSVLRAAELQRLAEAIARQPGAAAVIRGNGGGDAVPALRALGGEVAAEVERCVDVVGWWVAGAATDIDEPVVSEMPGVLAEALRAAVARVAERLEADPAAELRAAIPAARRAMFDEMLADARAVHRIRDERALYCDVWATGVLRRGVLEAGRRLAGRRLIDDAEHALDADAAELQNQLTSGRGPSAEELALRRQRRRQADPASMPEELGTELWAPIPLDWLSPEVARTERAFRTFLMAMEEQPVAVPEGARGLPASPGVSEGRARIVNSAEDLSALRSDDVIVAGAATPSLIVVLPLVAALVTDRGGMLSHAAIVARELGVPAVTGTGDATRRIPDGARVRVDGGAGLVTVLGSPS